MFNDIVRGKLITYFYSKGFVDYKRGWMTGTCPECGEDRMGKFAVHIEDNRGNCFMCGCKDKPFLVFQKLEGIRTYNDAMKHLNLFEDIGYIPLPKEVEREVETLELPKEYQLIGLKNNHTEKIVQQNLRNRGFSVRKCQYAGIGYCVKGEYARRIIIPYYANGRLIYFNARRFIELGTKFKNPSTERYGIGKTQMIYNIDALYMYNKIWLFESATNALTIGANATGTGGKILSPWQISQYVASPCKKIIIGLDDDAMIEAYKLGLQLCKHKKVKILRFPKGKDANKIGREATIKLEKETPYQTYQDIYKLYMHERSLNPY